MLSQFENKPFKFYLTTTKTNKTKEKEKF